MRKFPDLPKYLIKKSPKRKPHLSSLSAMKGRSPRTKRRRVILRPKIPKISMSILNKIKKKTNSRSKKSKTTLIREKRRRKHIPKAKSVFFLALANKSLTSKNYQSTFQVKRLINGTADSQKSRFDRFYKKLVNQKINPPSKENILTNRQKLLLAKQKL